jgi:hypothetical protein
MDEDSRLSEIRAWTLEQEKGRQAKYNRSAMENATPITMQSLARAREKPSGQEQWEAMEKTMRRTMGTVGKPGGMRRFGILVMPG